ALIRDGTRQCATGGGDAVGARWPRLIVDRWNAQAEEGGAPRALRMTWIQRLKRVFSIEIETCQRCGGKLEVTASIEDAELIRRILQHRAQHGDDDLHGTPFAPRAPPPPSLL